MKTSEALRTTTLRVTIAGNIRGDILRMLQRRSLSAVGMHQRLRKQATTTQAAVYHALHALLRYRFVLLDESLTTAADADRILAKVAARSLDAHVPGQATIYRLTETGIIAALTLDLERAAERNQPPRMTALRQEILARLIHLGSGRFSESEDTGRRKRA